MRLLRYLSTIALIVALSAFLGGCKNPDNTPPSGFKLPPSPVKVVFTDPTFRVEGSHPTGTSDPYTLDMMEFVGLDMLEMSDLMAEIDAAQSTIDLCTTRINNHDMVNRLVNLATRGVNIRIVTEKGYFNDPNSVGEIQQLLDAGVSIRTDNDDINRQMHERYWIIDNYTVLCGSGDLLDKSFYRSTNNTQIFKTALTINAGSDVSEIATITDAFFFDFTQMFDRGLFGKNKETMLKHTFKIGIDVQIYFGPNDNPRVMITDQLNNVNENLFYAINQLTDGSIGGLIGIIASIGSLSVDGVYDLPSAITSAPPNAQAYNFPQYNGMNHKYMVIDVPITREDYEYFSAATSNDPVVVTGSCNWTAGGLDLNDETLVVVHDLTLAYRYSYFGEAGVLLAAAANTGRVFGVVRSAYNNVPLEVTLTIESRYISSMFPGTPPDEPVEVDSNADAGGYYEAWVRTGELFRLESSQPEGHLIPVQKFQYGDTFVLLPGASYEGNFYPKLAPTGTGTGGT